MKSTYRFGAAGVALVTALSLASAAQAAPVTEQATARAEIVQALTVDNTSDLDFGKVALTGAAGVVTVNPAGAVTTCDATLACYDTTSAASFDVTGSVNKALTVRLPAANTILSNGTDDLVLSSYTTSAAAVAGETYYTITLSATGTGTFSVGGTLAFDGTESDGVYTGTFDVAVDYL